MKKPGAGRRSSRLNVYANLSARRKQKADSRARRKAEYLASLPKNPVKRFLYRIHPRRFFAYWFSREGGIMALRVAGVGVILLAILIGALFAYYRRELNAISPGEVSKRVQTTVTKYFDRNGALLWEDKGDGDYKLVIDSKDISDYMKNATVAIEDKDFYQHPGISPSGLIRAAVTNFTGGEVQGGSTLTQQLIKNVFFTDDANKRGLDGIPRKIKEVIMAIEVERMYNKDQILTLYLNEVPYGGRRNGVESAARTYFGKSAKDLNLAEAALLAGIPQQPFLYNPYYLDGNADLIERQHIVIDKMVEQNYVTKQQAEDAKKVAILDTIKPELAGDEGIKAPHFVLQVRSELEREFGQSVVRRGGLTVKTTLDARLQDIAEKAVNDSYEKYIKKGATGADNIAMTSIDVPTGQILSMVGSYNFNDKEFGAQNAATSLLQPGSSIKPFDYGELFKERPGQNYGAGTILADEDISKIYGSKLGNFDGRYMGPITVREALGNSRNPPAVKAALIVGVDNMVNLARDMGNHSYCVHEEGGASAAIGGCRVRQVEHVNAYASIARGGVYKPEAYVLEVKNAQGQTLKQWKDESKKVLDSQITFILSDILTDPKARQRVFGAGSLGMNVPGVKTATKTGTTDDGKEHAKDGWMMSYTPRLAAGAWAGRHDGGPLRSASNLATGAAINDFMARAHKEIYQPDGSWKTNDWFAKPPGVQTVSVNGRADLYPSWFKKPQDAEGVKMTFDRVSKKKATSCTPERAKQEVTVQKYQDPLTKKDTLSAPDGFDANKDDDFHKCEDVKPFVSLTTQSLGSGQYKIKATVNQGTHGLQTLEIRAEGQLISSQTIGSPGEYSVDHTFSSSGSKEVSATVIDSAYYDGTISKTVSVSLSGSGNNNRTISTRGRWWD